MDSDMIQVVVAFGLWLLASAYFLIRAWRRKELKYRTKEMIFGAQPMLSLIATVEVTLLVVAVLPTIVEAVTNIHSTSQSGRLLLGLVPGFCILLVMGLWFWGVYKFNSKPLWKFTAQELERKEQGKAQWRAKLPKALKWLARETKEHN